MSCSPTLLSVERSSDSAAGLGAESVNLAAALRAGDGELTEPLALALFDISYVFGSYATGIGFGVAMLAIGAVALRSGKLLPRWLAFVAVVIGLAMVTPLAGYVLGEYTVAPCFLAPRRARRAPPARLCTRFSFCLMADRATRSAPSA